MNGEVAAILESWVDTLAVRAQEVSGDVDDLARVQAEFELLGRTLEASEESYRKERDRAEELACQVRDLQQTIERRAEEKSAARQEHIERQSGTIRDLKHELDSAHRTNDAYLDEIRILKATLAERRGLEDRQSRTIRELKNELGVAKRMNDDWAAEVRGLRAERGQQKVEVARLNRELWAGAHEARSDMEARIGKLLAENTNLLVLSYLDEEFIKAMRELGAVTQNARIKEALKKLDREYELRCAEKKGIL